MKKEHIFTIVFFIIALIGLWILLKSPTLGNNTVNQFIRTNMGGSGDTSTINILLEQYITTYRLAGAILLSGGFLGTILFSIKFSR